MTHGKRLITFWYILFASLAGVLPLVATEPPTVNQAANATAAKITAQSHGLLTLRNFSKLNGQKSVFNGVEMYTMDCFLEIIATQDCALTGYVMGNWNGTFGAIKAQKNSGELDKFNPFLGSYAGNKQLSKGDLRTFKITMQFDLTEAGWRTEGMLPPDSPYMYVQPASLNNSSPVAQ